MSLEFEINTQRISSRFDAIEKLEEGWDGLDSIPISKKNINLGRLIVKELNNEHSEIEIGAVEDGSLDINCFFKEQNTQLYTNISEEGILIDSISCIDNKWHKNFSGYHKWISESIEDITKEYIKCTKNDLWE